MKKYRFALVIDDKFVGMTSGFTRAVALEDIKRLRKVHYDGTIYEMVEI